MTVYVDNMMADYYPKHRPGAKYVLSHMIADTDEELFAMAAKIGVSRRWFQGDHFDVTQSCKALAIKYGARLITWRQCAAMTCNRRFGYDMGTPETAEGIAQERRARRLGNHGR